MARVIGIRVLRRNADGSIECVEDPTGCCDQSGDGTLTCITACDRCPTGTASLYEIELVDAGDCVSVSTGVKVLSYQPLDNLPCRWATDFGDEWELYFDPSDELWYLVGGGGELIYSTPNSNWDCSGENSLNLVSASCVGADDNMTVIQDYPCGVIVDGCDHIFPLTLTGTFDAGTGTCGCYDQTFDMVWNGTAWVGSTTACSGNVLTFTLTPVAFVAGSSTWTLTTNGGTCSFMPTMLMSSMACGTINVTSSTAVVSGCCSSTNAALTITE